MTHYLKNKGMLPRHQDYSGPAPYPLIQAWVALSRPGQDFQEGNLVIYSKSGRRYRVEADLEVSQGDALLFNKALYHEVETTKAGGPGSVGRCTVLIGSRAPVDSFWQARKKRLLYGPPLYRALALIARTLKPLRF